ncbi:MAG TPA: CPBP family intramembrane glutamic endopeptidase [Thermoanaerobaculia bacterium]|nr:CPBP family intramembrane glutamic endopeptidase [Thermoanaerobaculia bacterium]
MDAVSEIEPWRLLLPAVLALVAAWALDRSTARRGLQPPGFRSPARRALGLAALAVVLFRGVFLPLGLIGLDEAATKVDLSTVHPVQLFGLHAMMVAALLVWFLAGYAGVSRRPSSEIAEPAETAEIVETEPGRPVSLLRRFAEQFGFVAPDVGREIGVGVVLGFAAWFGVLTAAVVVGLLLYALGGEQLVPKRPPDLVPWIAGLPLALRVLASLSAGIVEETFFRGLLQPRIGLLASTVLFVLAHASYGQPLMLVGVTLLSVIFGLLVRWRQSIWAAIAAHVLFDAIQLLLVIPAALKLIDKAGALP